MFGSLPGNIFQHVLDIHDVILSTWRALAAKKPFLGVEGHMPICHLSSFTIPRRESHELEPETNVDSVDIPT